MNNDVFNSQMSIWLDCDTGHDDAFAILLAVYHTKANLIGISTTHGNASIEHTTHNTLAVLEAIGATHVPVIKGRDRPIRRDPSFAPDIHGESGLDGVTLLPQHPQIAPLSDSLTDAVNTILERPPNTVHIVATGPLTNIAILFSWSPELAMHIASLSIMGGAIGGGFTDAPLGEVEGEGVRFGNHSPWAEFNIYADPEAARTVFRNQTLARKTTLIPLDLTHLVRGTQEVQSRLFGFQRRVEFTDKKRRLSSVRSLMQEVLNFFATTYKSQFGIEDGPPLHDPLAVWVVLEPERWGDGGGERWDVDVVVEPGHYHPENNPKNHVGQTIIRPSANGLGVRIPRIVDINLFWNRIDDALKSAENRVESFELINGDNAPNTPLGSSPSPAPSPCVNMLSDVEREKRKASLNTWRVTAQERMRQSDMPQF